MNVQKMMRLDRWLGVPLCFAVTCGRALLPRRKPAGKVRSILFVKLAEQGSTVLAYRALQEAVRRVGRDRVFMAVFEDNRFILDALGVIPPENVITLPNDSLFGLLRALLQCSHVCVVCVSMRRSISNSLRAHPRCSRGLAGRPRASAFTRGSAKGRIAET